MMMQYKKKLQFRNLLSDAQNKIFYIMMYSETSLPLQLSAFLSISSLFPMTPVAIITSLI